MKVSERAKWYIILTCPRSLTHKPILFGFGLKDKYKIGCLTLRELALSSLGIPVIPPISQTFNICWKIRGQVVPFPPSLPHSSLSLSRRRVNSSIRGTRSLSRYETRRECIIERVQQRESLLRRIVTSRSNCTTLPTSRGIINSIVV